MNSWEEKVNQIRIYSGEKYEMVQEAKSGMVCAVTGLNYTYPGEGLGIECDSEAPALEPVLSYKIELPEGVTSTKCSEIYVYSKKRTQCLRSYGMKNWERFMQNLWEQSRSRY